MDNYDPSKNSVSSAESDQAGEMLTGKDGSMPGMSDGHANVVESMKINKGKTIVALGVIGAVILVFVIIIFIVNGMKVDYSGSYRVAKDLKAQVRAMRTDDDCKKVVTNADPTYVKMETFMTYVEACRDMTVTVAETAESLGKTEGIQRNGDISARYDEFMESFAEVQAGDGLLTEELSYYEAWHKWVLAKEEVDGWDQSDTDLEKAANILIKSGNKDLKKYGEGWLKMKKAAAQAYRAFYYADILATNRNELLKASAEAQKEYADWEAKNTIDIKDVVELARVDVSKAYADFEEMYQMIREEYEKNYERGSGDCLETLTDVVCD